MPPKIAPRPILPAVESGMSLVSLEAERARAEELFEIARGPYVGLAIAAASAFHKVHRDAQGFISRRDYDNALDIAAASLSRLVSIYTLQDSGEGWVAVSIDFARQRFANGATEVRCSDGRSITRLSVRRSDALSAISLVKRTGLPFSFS